MHSRLSSATPFGTSMKAKKSETENYRYLLHRTKPRSDAFNNLIHSDFYIWKLLFNDLPNYLFINLEIPMDQFISHFCHERPRQIVKSLCNLFGNLLCSFSYYFYLSDTCTYRFLILNKLLERDTLGVNLYFFEFLRLYLQEIVYSCASYGYGFFKDVVTQLRF